MTYLLPETHAVYAAPASEPVSLAEAKLHLQVDHSAEDTLITNLIVAAREYAESRMSAALITQTIDAYYSGWPCDGFALPVAPVSAIVSITYTLADGTTSTVSSSVYTALLKLRRPAVVLGYCQQWPADVLMPGLPIIIRMTAGYGAAAAVPYRIKQALLLHIKHMFENRSAVVTGQSAITSSAYTEMGIENLYSQFRLF